MTSDPKDDVPEWSMAEASGIERDIPSRVGSANRPFIRSVIARALVDAERRGIERAADTYREGAGPEDGRWDYFLSAELAIRQIGK